MVNYWYSLNFTDVLCLNIEYKVFVYSVIIKTRLVVNYHNFNYNVTEELKLPSSFLLKFSILPMSEKVVV